MMREAPAQGVSRPAGAGRELAKPHHSFQGGAHDERAGKADGETRLHTAPIDGDFYRIASVLNNEQRALLGRVRAFMEGVVAPVIEDYWMSCLMSTPGAISISSRPS